LAAVLVWGGNRMLSVTAIVVELLGSMAVYLAVRSQLLAAKRSGDWYAGLRQVAVADTALRTDPVRYPWLWEVPVYAVVAATAIVGVVRYPGLPERIPTHFDSSGAADVFSDKSVLSAFAVVGVQLVVSALLLALARVVLHAKAQLDPQDPQASVRHRRFVGAMTRAMLALVAAMDVTFLVTALAVWGVLRPSGVGYVVLTLAPLLLGVAGLVAVTLRYGQGGGRLRLAGAAGAAGGADGGSASAEGPEGSAGAVARDDDRFYKLGLFYFNPDDPSVWVPKRFGVGWTVNMARPATWLFLGGLAAVIAVSATTR
jgi:uncharacterized membrane protein